LVAVDGGTSTPSSKFETRLASIEVDAAAEAGFASVGLLLNMSRMFLLLVNSGSSFPLSGGTSLVGL
jgi:hypothetical protein